MTTYEDYDISEKFLVPREYLPPEFYEDQVICTEYPNRNSSQYRQKPVEAETKLWPFYQCLTRNSKGRFILATNSYVGRIWNGSIYAFDDLENEMEGNAYIFRTNTEASVSALKYIDDTLFVVGETDGQITVFNSNSIIEMEESHNLIPCKIESKKDHKAQVTCLDIFRGHHQKLVSGDGDGCLITWDVGSADLMSIYKIRFAHTDAINDISTTPNNDYMFATVSNDKSLLLWDMRDSRQCSALLENHKFQLKAIEYVKENQVLVGDKDGKVYLIDTKMPKHFIMKQVIDKHPIHKFIIQGQQVIILTDSTRLQVRHINETNMTSALDAIEAPDYLRDAVWINAKEFYVAGWNSYIRKYTIG